MRHYKGLLLLLLGCLLELLGRRRYHAVRTATISAVKGGKLGEIKDDDGRFSVLRWVGPGECV